MIARNSAGRSVSLLNDESYEFSHPTPTIYHTPCFNNDTSQLQTMRSYSSSPATPSLTHADSYDTSLSPTTPTSSYRELSPHMNYAPVKTEKNVATQLNYHEEKMSSAELSSPPAESERSCENSSHCLKYEVRGAYREPLVYDEDSYYKRANTTDHTPRRYPCRYRDSHHCQKTFTTSGHASRHSKIHTAEKGVSCTWAGCQKKFTRSDNMKQHLETHNKERLRSSKPNTTTATGTTPNIEQDSHRTENARDHQASMTTLTVPAGVKKVTGNRRSASWSRSADSHASSPLSQPQNSAHTSKMQHILNPTNEHLNLILSNSSTMTVSSYLQHGPIKSSIAASPQF